MEEGETNRLSIFACTTRRSYTMASIELTDVKELRGIQPATLGLPAPALETVYVILYDIVFEKGRYELPDSHFSAATMARSLLSW